MEIDRNLIRHWAFLVEGVEDTGEDRLGLWLQRLAKAVEGMDLENVFKSFQDWKVDVARGVQGSPEYETVVYRGGGPGGIQVEYFPEIDYADVTYRPNGGEVVVHIENATGQKHRIYNIDEPGPNPMDADGAKRMLALAGILGGDGVSPDDVVEFDENELPGGKTHVYFAVDPDVMDVSVDATMSSR